MDELEKYHMETLRLAVDAANSARKETAEREEAERQRAEAERIAQQSRDAEIASRLKFD